MFRICTAGITGDGATALAVGCMTPLTDAEEAVQEAFLRVIENFFKNL